MGDLGDNCWRSISILHGPDCQRSLGEDSLSIGLLGQNRLEVKAASGKGIIFVDATFVIIKIDLVPSFHQLLNTSLPGIEFTMQQPTNDRLPFLDVLPSGDFETTVYHKETNDDVVLHFNSNHPACHKRSCIKALFGRVNTHFSSEEARRQERTYLYRLFNDNRYPLNFIKRTLRQRPLLTAENPAAEAPQPTW